MRPAKSSLACAVVVGVLLAMSTAPEGLHGPCTAFAQAPTARAATTDFFVSPRGHDNWSGRLADPGKNDGPLATVARAREAVRALLKTQKEPRPVRVVLRGGTYYLDSPLVFGPEDSGTEKAPVVYAVAAGEKVVLSGGRRLAGGRWGEANGRKAWIVDIPEVKEGKWNFRQLFVSGQRRPRTRLPKEGEYRIESLPGYTGDFLRSPTKQFVYAPGNIVPTWRNLRDVEVVGITRWLDNRLPIESASGSTRTVTFDRPSLFALVSSAVSGDGTARPSVYWVENVFEALDTPGQWYLDRPQGRLYYLPRPGEDVTSAEIVAPRLAQVVRVVGRPGAAAHDLRFEGITFSHTEWQPPADYASSLQAGIEVPGALVFDYAERCAVTGGGVEHIGNYGVEVNVGCADIEISHNQITDIGAGGVRIGHFFSWETDGSGRMTERGRQRKAAMPKGPHSHRITVADNEIAHCGRFTPEAVGVFVGDNANNKIIHNHIYDLFYSGISVGSVQDFGPNHAQGNIVEYNHIHDVGQGVLSDLAGIYTCSTPGARIRYNLVHDVSRRDYGGWGIYPDEGGHDILIQKNLVYRCQDGALFAHHNRNITAENNIFAFNRKAQVERGGMGGFELTCRRNLVYYKEGKAVGDYGSGHCGRDVCAFDRNLYWNASGQPVLFGKKSLAEWQALEQDKNSLIADPLFVDPKKGDFRLHPGSPAAQIGFEPWDLTAVGPRPQPAALRFAGPMPYARTGPGTALDGQPKVDLRRFDESYFPPPEVQGGWRALVGANRPPSPQEVEAVRKTAGLDCAKLREAWDYCTSFAGPHSLLVIRHGWVAGQWHNFTDPRGIASCTKSVTALAMAKLFDLSDAGRLPRRIGIDDPAWSFLPEAWGAAEPARKEIRIRHLLTMTSGLTPYDGPYQSDYLDRVFAQRREAPPGAVWAYASVPVDLLSLILQRADGRTLGEFFNAEINGPIGTAPVKWGRFNAHTGGSGGPEGGARFSPRDLARVGYLVLHDGAWQRDGKRVQVVGAERLTQMTRWAPFLEKATWRRPNFAFEPDANQYYGHLWWNNRTGRGLGEAAPRDAIYMSGWGKQACFVVPSLDMVVVRLGPNRTLNEHPEFYRELWSRLMSAVVDSPDARRAAVSSADAESRPFEAGRFKGRIAYSCDGNHNDPDDWIASPVALAVFAEAGVKDRLVHFDYNSILTDTNPEWEKIHAESVLGAAERYGFDWSLFHDCRRDRDRAVAGIAKAINDSSADNPLYFIVAGPMEVPYLGIRQSSPEKRTFVYCISHSRWNDGFAPKCKFSFTKRSVIDQDVQWVQIRDQNRLLSLSPYGRPARPGEFAEFSWMRDSRDPKIRFLWERMVVSTRPDPSDAGMAYFLISGDEDCDAAKLKRLLEEHQPPPPISARNRIRLEAENFRHFEGYSLEDRNDKNASHRLNVRLAGGTNGRVRTRFDEPFARRGGRYDAEIRYLDEKGSRCRFAFFVGGVVRGPAWESTGDGRGWTTRTIRDVEVNVGDEVRVDAEGPAGRLDYVQLDSTRSASNGDAGPRP